MDCGARAQSHTRSVAETPGGSSSRRAPFYRALGLGWGRRDALLASLLLAREALRADPQESVGTVASPVGGLGRRTPTLSQVETAARLRELGDWGLFVVWATF